MSEQAPPAAEVPQSPVTNEDGDDEVVGAGGISKKAAKKVSVHAQLARWRRRGSLPEGTECG
jgi:hypothetical protein